MLLIVAVLNVFISLTFAAMFIVKVRNRGTFPGYHRHPDDVRRKRNEEVETTQGWQI